MKFGAVIGNSISRAKILKEVGYDYAELNISEFSLMDDDRFEKYLSELREVGIPCEVGCIFLPSHIRTSDPDMDEGDSVAYLERAISRAHKIGIQTIVFGSGGARKIPDDVDINDGFAALVKFVAKLAGPAAQRYGIRIAIEPLSSFACNVIHTVDEAAALARLSGCDNVGALADIYHMTNENDPVSAIDDKHGVLFHTHTSFPTSSPNLYPKKGDGFDQYPFVKAAYKAGCPRMSVEAHIDEESFRADAEQSLSLLREVLERVMESD